MTSFNSDKAEVLHEDNAGYEKASSERQRDTDSSKNEDNEKQDKKFGKKAGEVDQALEYFDNSLTIDKATNRRLLRKIDLYVCSVMCILYACQYMDKTSNSYASIMGLRKDLNMKGNMYSWTGTAFHLGYLVFEFPSSFLLQRFPLAKTISFFILLWGIVICLHATPNYAGFVFLRTALGMLESAITPAFVLITSQWYKKEEQFFRTSIWFAFNGFGTIMGAGIAYGLATRQDQYSIEAWKILFIIIGLYTILLSFIVYFHLPDVPSKAWFLSETERKQVVVRIRGNQQGFGNKHFKKYQFIEAFKDIRTYLYFIGGITSCIPNGGMQSFSSIVMTEDFGYTKIHALLMDMPAGAVKLVALPLFGLMSRWIPHRMAIASVVMVLVDIFTCMFAFASNDKARLAGYYLISISPIAIICLLSCFSANTAGYTKKVTVNAIYLVGYAVGNVVGPQTFISNQAPGYTGAKISWVVCYCVNTLVIMIIYYINWRANKVKDEEQDAKMSRLGNIENIEFADLTDFENPLFRYTL